MKGKVSSKREVKQGDVRLVLGQLKKDALIMDSDNVR
jgi:hypothetical protein